MLSDDERQALPDPMRVAGMENLSERFTADKLREYGWACERAAYERAAQECKKWVDGNAGRFLAGRIRALGRQHEH